MYQLVYTSIRKIVALKIFVLMNTKNKIIYIYEYIYRMYMKKKIALLSKHYRHKLAKIISNLT